MTPDQLRILNDRVAIRPAPKLAQSEGGILFTPGGQEQLNEGLVIGVGPGTRNEATGALMATTVKAGDRVLYGPYGGQTVKFGDESLLLMKEEDIFAVID